MSDAPRAAEAYGSETCGRARRRQADQTLIRRAHIERWAHFAGTKGRGMNYGVLGWVVIHCMAAKSNAMVLAVIAGHAGDDGRCWPSEDTIGALAGCDARTVRRAINALAEAGELSYVPSKGPPNAKGERPNLYTVPERYRRPAVETKMSAADKMSREVVKKDNIDSSKEASVSISIDTSVNTSPDKMSGTEDDHQPEFRHAVCHNCGKSFSFVQAGNDPQTTCSDACTTAWVGLAP